MFLRRYAPPILASLVLAGSLGAQAAPPTIAEKTRGLNRIDGFVPLYWDAAAGKLWMEIRRLGEELIYITGATTGLGSNDIGLDRGQIGRERIVRFERVGPRVLLVQPNQDYRSSSADAAERRAVRESFATSTLWGFRVEAESDGAVLVDATDFALRDVHDAVGALTRARQGTFRLDPGRSAIHLPNTRGFPRNTEIEVSLTFTSDNPGPWVRSVAPSPEAVTLQERHSFVALPEPGYEPRRFDPRAGFFGISYADYSTPLGEPIRKQFIARHRLRKRNPGAAVSDPVAPIVYYLDRGTPEPVRSALLDGARWWNQAFEAAGYRNAFRVELMPEDADPMDVRYNVIQWVHRSTRGWSYGNTVTDPRTGEIIKGHVSLGSLRVRQDYLIAEGLLSPYRRGDERAELAERMALSRLRQLSAHEVGHTLGLQHNYIASTAGRASVMDYPHPLVRLAPDGSIDLSEAYDAAIGAWDKEAIRFGYSDFPDGTDQARALDSLLAAARARNLLFLADQDARPAGSAHPQVHLWDNGADAATELDRVMDVRRAALRRFGEAAIRAGAPLATMEEALVPLYLHHRYQVEAAVKVVGGQFYTYAMRGDRQTALRPVPAADQWRALRSVLRTLAPAELAFPEPLLGAIPPRPSGVPEHRELFEKTTDPVFDAITPAAGAADLVAQLLLNGERASRLVQQHALDAAQPGLAAVLDTILSAVERGAGARGYQGAVGRAVERVVVDRLMELAHGARNPEVRAVAQERLRAVARRAGEASERAEDRAHKAMLAADIGRFLDRPWDPERLPRAFPAPPGAPIGEP